MTGSGTVADPYVIWDVDDLQNIALDLDAYYILGQNINASVTSGWNGGDGFDPIGTSFSVDPFTGQFDGKGYTITALYIDRAATDYVGLFAATRDTGGSGKGVIQNVTLASVDITGRNIVGALVGDAYTLASEVINCHSSGVVAGSATGAAIGGLVGILHSNIERCTSSCPVDGEDSVGGLIGQNVGDSTGNTVTGCFATGAVTGTGNYAGGLIGECLDSSGVVSQSYATGDVVGVNYVGGLVGISSLLPATKISDCYAKGDVTGTDYVGGFVGIGDVLTEDCYSTGAVNGVSNDGGFCGFNNDTINDCFWDITTSGMVTSDGGTGEITPQMKDVNTFQNAGWAVQRIWNVLSYCSSGYPCLIGVNICCAPTPIQTDLGENKVVLEGIRNLEIVYGGKFYIDKSGNAVYESRFHRKA